MIQSLYFLFSTYLNPSSVSLSWDVQLFRYLKKKTSGSSLNLVMKTFWKTMIRIKCSSNCRSTSGEMKVQSFRFSFNFLFIHVTEVNSTWRPESCAREERKPGENWKDNHKCWTNTGHSQNNRSDQLTNPQPPQGEDERSQFGRGRLTVTDLYSW